ncbi:hypothetical protein HK101_001701 [Irineochytrium annulatum]|nr:hypothetical protein HK101_001701 [Irineochytrium annulatum]
MTAALVAATLEQYEMDRQQLDTVGIETMTSPEPSETRKRFSSKGKTSSMNGNLIPAGSAPSDTVHPSSESLQARTILPDVIVTQPPPPLPALAAPSSIHSRSSPIISAGNTTTSRSSFYWLLFTALCCCRRSSWRQIQGMSHARGPPLHSNRRVPIENVRVHIHRNDHGRTVVKTSVKAPGLGTMGRNLFFSEDMDEYEYEDEVLNQVALGHAQGHSGAGSGASSTRRFDIADSLNSDSLQVGGKEVRRKDSLKSPFLEIEEMVVLESQPAGASRHGRGQSGMGGGGLNGDQSSITSMARTVGTVEEPDLDDVLFKFVEALRNLPAAMTSRFKFKGLLGYGGNGYVADAVDMARDNEEVAIKFISKAKIARDSLIDSPAYPFSIPLEAEILRNLSHPNIAQFVALYQNEKHLFLVMEKAKKLVWKLGGSEETSVPIESISNFLSHTTIPAAASAMPPHPLDPLSDLEIEQLEPVPLSPTPRRSAILTGVLNPPTHFPLPSTTPTSGTTSRSNSPRSHRRNESQVSMRSYRVNTVGAGSTTNANASSSMSPSTPQDSNIPWQTSLSRRRHRSSAHQGPLTAVAQDLPTSPFNLISSEGLTPIPYVPPILHPPTAADLVLTPPTPIDTLTSSSRSSVPPHPAPAASSSAAAAAAAMLPWCEPSLTLPRHAHPGDLYDFITMYGATPSHCHRHLLRQLVSAYAHIRSRGFVYLDFRGENVLVDDDLTVKVVDFGMAQRECDGGEVFVRYGTREHCCPEALRGEGYRGEEGDVWALGLLGVLLATGDDAFHSEEEALVGALGCLDGVDAVIAAQPFKSVMTPATASTDASPTTVAHAPSDNDSLSLTLDHDDIHHHPKRAVPSTSGDDETAPLLSRDHLPGHAGAPVDLPSSVLTCAGVIEEARSLVPKAWPVSVGYLLHMSLNLAAIVAVGRHSTNALASMALAGLYAGVTGFSIAIGMASGLDTLCSQAYGEHLAGKLEKTQLGRHMNRGIFVLLLLSFPILTLWSFTEPLLLLVGQNSEIAQLSASFIKCLMPSLPFVLVGEGFKRFLNSQGYMSAALKVLVVVAPTNALLQYLLVWSPWNVGPIGAPIGLSCSYILTCVLLYFYIRFVEGGDAWLGPSLTDLMDFPQVWLFVKLGAPDVLMVCSEWWSFETIALFAGMLGPEYLAAQAIALNMCGVTYTIPLGIGIATTARIGNALGAGTPNRAKSIAWTALSLGVALSLLSVALLFGNKDRIAYLWTKDEAVAKLVALVMPLAALFQVSDAVGGVSGGILRGIGRQDLGGYLNLCGHYVIGIPWGYYACFHLGWKLFGLWSGLTLSLICISFVQVAITYRTNWAQEAENAHLRVGEGSRPSSRAGSRAGDGEEEP